MHMVLFLLLSWFTIYQRFLNLTFNQNKGFHSLINSPQYFSLYVILNLFDHKKKNVF